MNFKRVICEDITVKTVLNLMQFLPKLGVVECNSSYKSVTALSGVTLLGKKRFKCYIFALKLFIHCLVIVDILFCYD